MKRESMTTHEAYMYLYENMCEKINVDPKSIDYKKQFWFWKHTWTTKEEEEFVDWIIDELYTNNAFRRAISKLYYRPNKKLRRKLGREVVDNFGWKIKD